MAKACKASDMTFAEYLAGVVAFSVPEDAVRSIMLRRGIEGSPSFHAVDLRLRRLCEADLYLWICTSTYRRGGVTDRDNSWSHGDGGWTLTDADRRYFRGLASRIYDELGEEMPVGTRFSLSDHGIKRANRPVSHTFHHLHEP